jgi:hypothetical protein
MASNIVPCFLTTLNGARCERSCAMAFGNVLALFYDEVLVRDSHLTSKIQAVAINRNRIFTVSGNTLDFYTYDLKCVARFNFDNLGYFNPHLIAASDERVFLANHCKAVSVALDKPTFHAIDLPFRLTALHVYGDRIVGCLENGQIKQL